MWCLRCGQLRDAGHRYCWACGGELRGEPENVCMVCGESLEGHRVRYCSEKHARIGKSRSNRAWYYHRGGQEWMRDYYQRQRQQLQAAD